MRRRVILSASTGLILVVALSIGPASAGSGTLVIGDAGADGEIGSGFFGSGSSWSAESLCLTASMDTHRIAMEFPLAGLPANATITSAILSLAASNGIDPTGPTALYVYPGDGALTGADVQVTGTPILFTPPASGYQDRDVTALLTPAVVASSWAGFSLRQDPPSSEIDHWNCPNGSSFPILTIQYHVPDATLVISDASAWIGGEAVFPGPFADNESCRSGRIIITVPVVVSTSWRCAFEFDISPLPPGATITGATLSLRNSSFDLFCLQGGQDCPVDVAGYAGNGTEELADLDAGSVLTSYEPSFLLTYADHDVTAFVAGLYGASDDWAGFRLSGPSLGAFEFDSPDDEQGPILTIEYDLAAPPAATALPNAALPEPGPMSDLAFLGFGLLLIGSLGTLAAASARVRTR